MREESKENEAFIGSSENAVTMTTPLIFAVFVASTCQFLVGYNTGVMNAPESVVFPNHSTASWAIGVAAFAVGGPFGAMVAGDLADSRGRRGALLIDIWIFFSGGLVQTISWNMYLITLSRFVIGFASGFSSVLVPIYLGEVAPPSIRGMLGTLTQFALVIGILVADLLAFPFATPSGWRVLFVTTCILALIQIFCAPWLLESPRWLLGKDPSSREARSIIQKLRGFRFDHEVDAEVNNLLSSTQSSDEKGQEGKTEAPTATFAEMFSDSSIRILVISALVLQMAQQLCGINAVFYYSTLFFDGVIESPLVGTTIVGAVNVVATYVALLLMDSCGRRTMILWSSGGMFVSCVVIVMSLLGYFSNIVALVAVNVYVSFFEIGLGPIPWLIVAEMFDAKYVATAMSASSQLNWGCNFIIGLVFPYMNKYLGAYSFGPFATVLLFTFVYAAMYLPETQGTTPEDLRAALMMEQNRTTQDYYNNVNVDVVHRNPIDIEWRLAMDQLKKEEQAAMKRGTYNYGFRPIDQNPPSGVRLSSSHIEPPSDWKSTVGGA